MDQPGHGGSPCPVSFDAHRPRSSPRNTPAGRANTPSMSAQHSGEFAMAGQGSTGNVIAAVCSLFIPGLGQLVQGRVLMALVHFVLAGVLWLRLPGGALPPW